MFTFKVDDLKRMNENLREFADFLRSENVCDEDVFSCRLVSCELISNVIIHGGEAAEFYGEIDGGNVYITVCASSLDRAALNPVLPDVLSENGRGMYIVKSICLDMEKFNGGLKVKIKLAK